MNSKPFEKHPTLWLEDGNIVLIAEAMGFKVHRSILARNSEVFRDMLSVPQPEVEDNPIDGCPVVRLLDDRKEEWETVLDILFGGGSRNFYKETISIPFQKVASAVRLGTKYQFQEILGEALARLAVCFPKRLEDFHNKVSTTNTHRPPPNVPSTFICPIQLDRLDAATVLHLSRALGLHDLLPAAVYTCAQIDTDVLIERVQYEDTLYGLDFDDLKQCMQARTLLQASTISLFGALATGTISSSCTSAGLGKDTRCKAVMHLLLKEVMDSGWMSELDCLSSVEDSLVKISGPGKTKLCNACASHVKTLYRQDRNRAWAELSAFCGVEPEVDSDAVSSTDSDSSMEE